MENTAKIVKIIMFLSRKHRSAMRLLSKSKSPLTIKVFDREHSISLLHDKGLVEINGDYVSLSILGKDVIKYWQNQIEQEQERQLAEDSSTRKESEQKLSDWQSTIQH